MNKPGQPAVLRVPISIRAFAEEEVMTTTYISFGGPKLAEVEEDPKPPKRSIERAGPTEWSLVFDVETTTDASQRAKLGFYQLYQGDRLEEEGVFCDRAILTADEVRTIETFAADHGLGAPLPLDAFRAEVLVARGIGLGGTIVTFNGAFDFSRVALDWSPARASRWRRKMRGGFSLRLSGSDNESKLQIKNLNARANVVELTAPRRQPTSRSRRKKTEQTPTHRGFHIDVKTLAAALTARSHSLESLCDALKTTTRKHRSEEHGGSVTRDYLTYARADVQATWECYVALIAKYRSYGLNAAPHTIYSEAGIGKAALETMGIVPWMQVQPGGPDKASIGRIISTYYGGRTEVRIRRSMVRTILTDFMSMYPTVCTLQGLWRFVIGQGFSQRDGTAEIRAFLNAATPDLFQDQKTWLKLPALVRLSPDCDLLPIRASYDEPSPTTKTDKPPNATIGLNYLTSPQPLWFTLAEVLVAKFLSGKTPVIDEAIIFEPNEPQTGLKPIKLMGRRVIDPAKSDFYRELIRARQEEEAAKAGKSPEEQAEIEAVREALKITANSTSYGIFVQVNVNAEPKGAFVRVHLPDGTSFLRRMKKIETAGPWFNPLVATLITGAARLMLALAEHRTLALGLDWAFCDTDSLAIAKPDEMDEATFVERAQNVVDWFGPLNPYGDDAPILKIEKVNYENGVIAPLYCWAISSKRYALFNISDAGEPIIRKASAHGLGHLIAPYSDDDAPTCFPSPRPEVLSGKEKLKRWHYDVWCAILRAVLEGRPDHVRFDYHPALGNPTVSQFTPSNPEHVGWFDGWNEGKEYPDQLKPFGFLYILHLSRYAVHPDNDNDPLEQASRPAEIHPVAPFDRDLKKAVAQAFDRTQAGLTPIDPARLETYAQMLSAYPFRAEAKFLNGRPFDTGRTERRHIHAVSIDLIGKEADRMDEEYLIGIRGELAINYGGDPRAGGRAFIELRTAIAAYGKAAVARATTVPRGALAKIERGEFPKSTVPPWRILEALDQLNAGRTLRQRQADTQLARLRTVVANEGGIRAAARKLGIDPSNLAKRLKAEGY